MVENRSYVLSPSEKRLTLWFVGIGFAHLAIGITMGLLQGLQYAGVNLYPLLLIRHYYQGLSIHGVFNVLLFTTFFILGFLGFVTAYGLQRRLYSMRLAWITFWVAVVGAVCVDWALLANQASVMYTSYAPLRAHPAYYLGLTLIVVSTWLLLWNMAKTYLAWRREHPQASTPLITFGALATMAMWGLASLGIAVQFLFLLIPWSLGLMSGTDPLLSRTLFWLTGHPLVYFWLLPAYMSWYFMLPRQAGGKLFSEPLARLAFLLFIPLSLPVGLHHQFTDPGIAHGPKILHTVITFAVFLPSMLTAFTVLASLETGARARGGKGLLGWVRALPWHNPSFSAQALAMVMFALGGISGLVNASYTLNLKVHNTLYIPGHFHLTVSTAVGLTYMGIAYWLVPHLTGRSLWRPRVAVWQTWLWFIGMAMMSRGMSWAGLLGAPRRTMLGSAPYALSTWVQPFVLLAIGGTVLTISAIVFYSLMVATVVRGEKTTPVEVPLAEPLEVERHMPKFLDRFAPWVAIASLLLLIAYGPVLYHLVADVSLTAIGMKPY